MQYITMKKSMLGVTLMELVIVVTIIGILAAIAYPAYQDQMITSRRSDGQSGLLSMAALMEHYYTENNTYVGATPAVLGITSTTQQGYYKLSVSAATTTTYTLTATPISIQTADTTCAALTLTNTNVKAPNPTVCWE